MKAAAGCQDDQLGQRLKQVWNRKTAYIVGVKVTKGRELTSRPKILLLSPLSPHLWKYSLVSASIIFTCSLKWAMLSPVFNIFFCSRKICNVTKKIFVGLILNRYQIVAPPQWTWSLVGFATHGVGDVIGDTFAKHRSGQSRVDVFGIQVLVLAVEEQRGCFATQQVGECAPHHRETEHGSVLWVENRPY